MNLQLCTESYLVNMVTYFIFLIEKPFSIRYSIEV